MKLIIKRLLLRLGLCISKTTKPALLNSFFSKVHPITTDYDLIRIGGESDSGYLIPNDLEGVNTCFSPGVSLESFFENEISKLGIRSFLADYSVESPQIDNPMFSFEKKYIGIENNTIFMTLDNWIHKNVGNEESDMLLQMDIEGGEYDVLLETSNETLSRFRIIIIEFHNLDKLYDPSAFQLISGCFSKILKSFSIVHIHPNNSERPICYKGFQVPPVMEFTFLNKNRILNSKYTKSFPHELDRPNSLINPIIHLPTCWYK